MTALASPCGSHFRNGRLTPSVVMKTVSVRRAGEKTGASRAAVWAKGAGGCCASGAPSSNSGNSAPRAARRNGRHADDPAWRALSGLRIIGSTGGNGYHCGRGAVNRRTGISGRNRMAFETIDIDDVIAACNGGGGPLGHPRVYLNLTPHGRVECP